MGFVSLQLQTVGQVPAIHWFLGSREKPDLQDLQLDEMSELGSEHFVQMVGFMPVHWQLDGQGRALHVLFFKRV